MNSPALTAVSLILSIISIGLAAFLLWQIQGLLKLKNTFFAGGKASSLEELLHSIARHINDLERVQDTANKHIEILEHNTMIAVQKVGVIRFNPFNDGGGNFSFCLALLDATNSGFVLTSMHGREQHRIYSKRIDQGTSETQLTDEEENAIRAAEKNYRSSVITKPKSKTKQQ